MTPVFMDTEQALEYIKGSLGYSQRDAAKAFRNVLRSGEVYACWSTLDHKQGGMLRPQDADHEFFRVMGQSRVPQRGQPARPMPHPRRAVLQLYQEF